MRLTIPQWICYFNTQLAQLEKEGDAGALLYGEDTPPQSLGKEGDLYMQFNGGFLLKKEEGNWMEQGKIQLGSIDGGEVL